MIFEKRCGKSTLKNYLFFFIDNNPFEISQDYSYLELSVCANVNFLNAKVCVNKAVLAWSHLQKLFTTRFRPIHWGDFPSAVFRVLSETYAISLSESPCTGDQSSWNVSPVIWTPDLIVGVIPDFSLCTHPLFPSGKIGVGRGVCTQATGFESLGFWISQAGKNFLDSEIGITLHRGDNLHITTMSIFNLKHCCKLAQVSGKK